MLLLPQPKRSPTSPLLVASEAFLGKKIHEGTQDASCLGGRTITVYTPRQVSACEHTIFISLSTRLKPPDRILATSGAVPCAWPESSGASQKPLQAPREGHGHGRQCGRHISWERLWTQGLQLVFSVCLFFLIVAVSKS